LRPLVQWTNASQRTPGQDVRAGGCPVTLKARHGRQLCSARETRCPHCGGEMRFLSVIEEPLVIEHILRHLRLWDPRPPGSAPPLAPESKFLSLVRWRSRYRRDHGGDTTANRALVKNPELCTLAHRSFGERGGY